jgi:hypothetical protein
VRRGSRGEAEEAGQQAEAIEKDLRPFGVHCEREYAMPGDSIDRARARVFPR